LDTEHLHTFLTVERRGSFTAAATELHLSQPAVSRRMQQLEEELGERLFERLGRNIHLTPAGRTLVGQARLLLGDRNRLLEAVRAHADPDRGVVRLGASTTPGLYLLPPVLDALQRDLPGLHCLYSIDNSEVIKRRVLANELDLGVIGGPVTEGPLVAESIVDDAIVCFARPDHPLASCSEVKAADLLAATWILREPGSATRALFEGWLRHVGGRLKHKVEIRDPEAAKLLVDAGLGLAWGSLLGLGRDLERGRFVALSIPDFTPTRTLSVVHHADKFISPVIGQVLERIAAVGSSGCELPG